jgi:hypothetical protein
MPRLYEIGMSPGGCGSQPDVLNVVFCGAAARSRRINEAAASCRQALLAVHDARAGLASARREVWRPLAGSTVVPAAGL